MTAAPDEGLAARIEAEATAADKRAVELATEEMFLALECQQAFELRTRERDNAEEQRAAAAERRDSHLRILRQLGVSRDLAATAIYEGFDDRRRLLAFLASLPAEGGPS